MPLIAVSRAAHGAMKLRPVTSYAFAAGLSGVRVLASEAAEVQASFPIVFLKEGDAFQPQALLGLDGRRNLFVGADGTWQGGYVPAMLRLYPFALGWGGPERKDASLLVDEAQLSEQEGEPLFGPDGTEGPVKRALDQLVAFDMLAAETAGLVAALAAQGLLEPLDGTQERMSTVSEAKLKALPDEAFLELRRSGALALAYAQLFSRGRLGALRARAVQQAGA